jgi:hypothetical protein
MKLKNFLYALLAVLSMVSCTAESDTIVNEEESTSISLEKSFNASSFNRQMGDSELELDQLVPVTTEEAAAILNVLRNHKNLTESNSVTTTEGVPGQTFLTISAEQCVDNSHFLEFQMEMITYADDNSLFYKSSKTCAKSDNYQWELTGFGLTSNGPDGTYKIECTSYLYFKVMEETIKFVQVPVRLDGVYNPENHHVNFTYSF